MRSLFRKWLLGVTVRESELLEELAPLRQRVLDLEDELRKLRDDNAVLRSERDDSRKQALESARKIADFFSYQTFGFSIFDTKAYNREVDARTEKKLERYKSAGVTRGRAMVAELTEKFEKEFELTGVEPVFAEEEKEREIA